MVKRYNCFEIDSAQAYGPTSVPGATLLLMGASIMCPPTNAQHNSTSKPVRLPAPRTVSNTSVEEALLSRRSVREFSDEPLTISEISQLLWAAQGITDPEGLRAAPSAGALYPLETHLVANNVSDLAAGVYRYTAKKHELVAVSLGDEGQALGRAAGSQDCVFNGMAVMVFSAVFERTTRKYGRRGVPYVYMEVGHAVENVCLQAVALDLGTVVVGAFDDAAVRKIVQTPGDQQPLALMPIGKTSGDNR